MNHKDLARRVLMDAFPQECAAVGQSAVDDVLAGVDIVPPEEGRPFPPMHDIFQFLKDVFELIIVMIPIIKFLWEQSKKKPTLPEVKAEAASRGVKQGKLSSDQADRAIKELLKDVKSLDDLTD